MFVEVSAITDTVKAAAGQQLKFTVNNGKAVSIAELTLAGYGVAFEYTVITPGTPATTKGIVNASISPFNVAKFEYRVVVTDEDNVEVKSEWKEVKVVDETVVAKVEVELTDGTDKVDFITVGETANEFEISKLIQADGEESPEDLTDYKITKAVSSNTNVAYWDGTNVVPVAAGTATFTIEVQETADATNKFEVTIKVVVKAVQKVTSAALKDTTVKYDKAASQSIVILIKDQNGDIMKSDVVSNLTDLKVKVNDDVLTPTGATGEITAVADFSNAKVGKQTVKVTHAVAGKTVTLGSFSVNVVDTADVESKYEFSIDKDSELKKLDLNKTGGTDLVTINVIETKDGVVQTPSALSVDATDPLYIRVAEGNFATLTPGTGGQFTVAVDASTANKMTKTGTVTVELVKVAGAKVTVVKTISIAVENTAPQITGISYVGSKLTLEDPESDLEQAIEDGFVVVTLDKGSFVYDDMIKDVTYIESNEALVIEIEALYGGKTITLTNVVTE